MLLWLYKIWHEWHFMCLGFFYFLYICRCERPLGAGQKSFYLSFIRSLSFMWQHVILVVVFQLLVLLWLHLSFPFVLLLFHLHFCFALDFVRGFIWIFWSSSIFTIHHSTEGRHENWTIGLYLRFFWWLHYFCCVGLCNIQIPQWNVFLYSYMKETRSRL